jgi:uncharacterized SAM-binding protein YcdF (DUF218 family)
MTSPAFSSVRILRRIIARLVPLLILIWTVGLIVFASMIPRELPPPFTRYDAMIALTGGEKRIPFAVELMRRHKAEALLISGVGDGFRVEEVDRTITPDLRARITYGMQARSTLGNARETRDWLRDHPNHRRVLIVTANYHMPRTQLLFNYYLQGYDVDYLAVNPSKFTLDAWVMHRNSLYLVLSEYHKWLVTLAHVYAGYDGLE